MEQRRLLSVPPAGQLGLDPQPAPCTPTWEIVISDDDGTLWGIDPDDRSPVFISQGRRFEDIAFCPWEDVSFYGFYGVSWSPTRQTSGLYHIQIDTCQQPAGVTTQLVGYIYTSGGSAVYLNALEFSARGTLYAAGYPAGSNSDELFTINLTTAVATHHQNLPTGYHSAGDVSFDTHGNLYLTTIERKLLKLRQPWVTPPQTFQILSGDLVYGDFAGLAPDPPQVMLGFRKAMNWNGKYECYPIQLGTGTLGTGEELGYHPQFDDILGATSRYTTAKADLSGAFFDATPDPSAAGGSLNLAFEVQNTGAKNAGQFDVHFYLSSDLSISTSDKYLGGWMSPGLAALSTSPRQTTTLSLPGARDSFWTGTGTYYVGMIVDSSNEVNESDETNNRNTGQALDLDALQIVVPKVSVGNVSATEGEAAALTVTLSAASTIAVTVDYATADGTATQEDDYEPTAGTLTFAPGETEKTIEIALLADALDEHDESILVNLFDADNALIDVDRATVTIHDGNPEPMVSINDVTIGEGNQGTTNAVFTVSLSSPSGKTVTVEYTTADDTAVAGEDFAATGSPPPLTFAPGQTEKTIEVPVSGDPFNEFNEGFFVNLLSAENAVVDDGQGRGTITNDDPQPKLSIRDVVVDPEGNEETAEAAFTVVLSPASGKTVTVEYATEDGSATAGEDYVAAGSPPPLTFAPGQTQQTIRVAVTGDTLSELDENFFVNLSDAVNAEIEDDQGEGTIVDDDLTTVSIEDVSVDPEGDGGMTHAVFTVTLSASSNNPVTVDYDTADGTAKADQDYVARSGQVRFEPGGTLQRTIRILVVGDALDEPDEDFFVNLSNPVNTTLGDGEGQAMIVDDDPEPTLAIEDVAQAEGHGGTAHAVFTVTLSPHSGKTVTVDYATEDGSARAGDDYQATTGTLTFPPDAMQQTISVPLIGETLHEFDENFFVNLSAATNAGIADPQRGEGTITNDDDPPMLSIDDVTVDPEGDAQTTGAVFTVSLAAASGRPVTVDYATADGTAVAGDDYEATSGTLTFPTGQTAQTITVPVIGDTTEEAEEDFFVNLTNTDGATLADGEGRGTIVDDDAPLISISDVIVDPEGNHGATNALFVISLSAPPAVSPVTVDFATADGTAKAGEDYVALSGTRTFQPGQAQTEATVSVPVLGDALSEADEIFFVNLSNPVVGVIDDGQGQGTIVDDDPLPKLSIDDVTVDPEGDGGGLTKVLFTVTLSKISGATVTVDYVTTDGTTTAGDDYVVTAGTLAFPPGATQQIISVSVVGDASDEFDESFFVDLYNAVYAEIDDGQGEGTIIDDDPLPELSIDDAKVDPEGNEATTEAVFTVSLSPVSGKTVTVDFATADGTATAGDDYQQKSETLTFPPGVTQQTVRVAVIGDALEESDETFTVALSSPDNATLADGQGQGTIIDDDTPLLSIANVVVDPEGDAGTTTAIFTVSLLPPSEETVTVSYATADGTATAGDDYQPTSGTLTFDPGQTQQTIEVPVFGDTLMEPDDEDFFVNLSNATGAEIADGQARATIFDDDMVPLRISFLELSDQDPTPWYPLETTRRGFLTAELRSDEGELALHPDQAQPPLATGKRIDWPAGAAGEVYYLKITGTSQGVDLRLANLVEVSPDGTQVAVYGTGEDDAFEASFAASPYSVIIKGLEYDATLFPLMTGVHFFGQGGSDDAVVTGSDGSDVMTLFPHSGTVTGPDYELQMSDFSSMTVHGEGGENELTLFDSAGDDSYIGAYRYGAMYGEGFSNRAYEVEKTYAEATEGVDVAKFYDSPGHDSYVAKPTYNVVSGEGFENVVRYFEGVHVYATAGGIDVARFYDSAGDDDYVATPTYAALYNEQYNGEHNGTFYNRAKYFEGVHAYATAGGSDLARFYDSSANDDFVATPTYAALYNASYRYEYTSGFYNRAKYFRGAHAYATAGGSDLARLYDSPEDDIFYADPSHSALYNDTYEFEYTNGFYNRAKFFQGVHAYATAGGTDVARLHGSEENDTYYGDPSQGALYRPGQYYNRGKFFEEYYADAHGGDADEATLNDLAGMEQWDGGGRFGNHWLYNFEYINGPPTPLAEGDQQGTKNQNSSAVDFLMGLEGLGENR